MDDLVRWFGEQIDLDEMHAKKDLAVLDRASAQGDWEAHYGYNLPYSELHAGGQLIGSLTAHREGLADGEQDQHAADALLVARMVRKARARAEQALREVEAKRLILDEYEKALDRRRLFRDDVASAGALLQMVAVVKLLALPFADREGFREEWRP